jgi:CelD/BcsL family acetyltransferase involved in cellulose biosynthesis
MAWRFEWLRSWDEVWEPPHVARWRAMCEAPGAYATPFVHPDLIRGWLVAMGGPGAFAPFFLKARHSGWQEVFWLLVRPRTQRRKGLLRRLVPAGDGPGGPYFAYNDPLVVPAAAPDRVLADGFWWAFERELRAHQGTWFDSCAIHRLREESLGDTAGQPVAVGSTYVRLDAYSDFDAYAAARPRAMASQVARKLRRLQADGRCALHLHGPGEREAALAWLPTLAAGQRARYPGSELPQGFFENVVKAGYDSGLVRCSVLRIDGRPASWRIDYQLGGTLYLAACSFDEALAKHSPGQLHTWLLLKWHMENGGAVYDPLIGEQAYKYQWTDGAERRLQKLQFESRSPVTLVRRRATGGLGKVRRLGERAIAAVGRRG